MGCSSDRELCGETYVLIYMGVLVAAFPAGTSKETPEGQLGWLEKRGSGRVGVPLPPLGCSSVDSSSRGSKDSSSFLLLFFRLRWRMAPRSSFPGWVLPSWKAVQELRSPQHSWGSAGSWWQEPWPSFTLLLPSLTTLTPHHDGTQGLRLPGTLWMCFYPFLTEGLPSLWLSSLMVQADPGAGSTKMGTNTSQGIQR